MGLYEDNRTRNKNEEIGKQAQLKELQGQARKEGAMAGATAENQKIEREIKQQAMAEAQQEAEKQRAMQIFQEGTRRGREEVAAQVAVGAGMIPMEEAEKAALDAESQGMQEGAEMNDINRMEQEDTISMASALVQQVDAAQKNGAQGEQLDALVQSLQAQIPDEKRNGVMQAVGEIQQQRAENRMNQGEVTPNPTVIPPRPPSPASQVSQQILTETNQIGKNNQQQE